MSRMGGEIVVSNEQQATFQGQRQGAGDACKACAAYPITSAIIRSCFDSSTPRFLPAGEE
jgi:hypothetical protein